MAGEKRNEKSFSVETSTDAAEIKMYLDELFQSESFSKSEQLPKILEYLIDQKLAGDGSSIKSYSIGVDALGKPTSFDPQLDPVVRVAIGRLRDTLKIYYSEEGSEDPIQIEIPLGNYNPVIRRKTAPTVAGADPESASSILPGETVGKFGGKKIHLVGALLAAVLVAWLAFGPKTNTSEEASVAPPASDPKQTVSSGNFPILAILPFSAEGNEKQTRLVNGIRRQLIVDFAQFKSIRVREMSPKSVEATKKEAEASSYSLAGSLTGTSASPRLTLSLTNRNRELVVWSKTVDFPTNDIEFYSTMVEVTRNVANELAAETGVIAIDGLTHLRRRLQSLGDENSTEYECVLRFYSFDASKNQEDETAARNCLQRLTSQGSPNSTVWASWALMQFLDWIKQPGPDGINLIDNALASANKAVVLDPNNAVAYEYLGSIQSVMGNADAAMESYQRGLQISPYKPSLRFLVGWQHAVAGNWEKGIPGIAYGVEHTPAAPGYMRIPLSMDWFRKGNFEDALVEAEYIVLGGDGRGIPLALASAIKLNDARLIKKYGTMLRASKEFSAFDPLVSLRRSFSNPNVLKLYEETLRDKSVRW